jgi:hypothetical protein
MMAIRSSKVCARFATGTTVDNVTRHSDSVDGSKCDGHGIEFSRSRRLLRNMVRRNDTYAALLTMVQGVYK